MKIARFEPRHGCKRIHLRRHVTAWGAAALGGLFASCSNPGPLKGGNGLTVRDSSGNIRQSIVQGDNAAQTSRQDQQVVRVRTYTVPAGSLIQPPGASGPATSPGSNSMSLMVATPMPVVEREELHANTELGAAQKDTARELGARLSSLRPVCWVGIGLFVFGLATLAWPPLKVIIGSVTTSVALMLGGVALVILPTLIVGNELLILSGVGLVAGAWFLAHRHGELRGILKSQLPQSGSDSKP
ncbi:MAG TPA: DUF308 domain-containing protein [Verrucomicrobiae bacterium]|nr:DUF308 domain-containing protein [Verrucomicrobiae bacterium]